MPTFTPPSRVFVPTISAATPRWQQRPFAYFKPSIPRAANVWVWTNGFIGEQQPPVWIPTANQPGVKKVYYGGGSYQVSDAEAADLTAAGYGPDITP